MHNAAMALRAHHRDHGAGQGMIAKEIGFKNLTQRVGGQVLNQAGDCICSVVKDPGQRATGVLQNICESGLDCFGGFVV